MEQEWYIYDVEYTGTGSCVSYAGLISLNQPASFPRHLISTGGTRESQPISIKSIENKQ
jgi:hypothetical protein